MATEHFIFEYDASANIYARIFDRAGQVFDFNDNTFKSLASATTPYKTAVERADMGGTGVSGYSVTVDLAQINNTGDSDNRYTIKAYDNAVPADTDNPVSDPLGFAVQFGELGNGELIVQAEISVKSTSGNTAQLKCWLERNGTTIDIDSVDAAATASITVREHGSGILLFTANATVADIYGGSNVFEFEQSNPGFTDDRQYDVVASITENGNTHTTRHAAVVIG